MDGRNAARVDLFCNGTLHVLRRTERRRILFLLLQVSHVTVQTLEQAGTP